MSVHGKTFFVVRLLTAQGRRTEETDFPVVYDLALDVGI
jgi:hypothetical protein